MKPANTNSPTPLPIRWFRLVRVGTLLLQGAATALLIFPLSSDRRRMLLKQRWSSHLLKALSIQLEVDLRGLTPACLVVANHISWLDIFVINAAFPAAFISKAEVRHWPLIGWLAALNDTVFLQRGSRGHTRVINEEIAAKLANDKHVALFPEGTTTDGSQVLNFHGALLQPALNAGRPVVPLALAYETPDGERSLAPRYDGQISLGECLKNIVACRQLVARLVACPALAPEAGDRRLIAKTARQTIMNVLGLDEIPATA